MVTDEDRDYMYRTYAKDPEARINLGIRRRLAPLLGNDRATIKLLNGLLFSFPGTPVLYYGDEINMGDNIYLGDRDGVIVYLTDGSAPRLADLAASLASLDASFTARAAARYPVVVFYDDAAAAADGGAPLQPGAAAALAAASAGPLTFIPVDLAALVPAAALAAAPRVLDYPGVGSFSLGYRLMSNFFAAPVAAQSVKSTEK
jgi:hypothetical protein